jgi:hypothetical protein
MLKICWIIIWRFYLWLRLPVLLTMRLVSWLGQDEIHWSLEELGFKPIKHMTLGGLETSWGRYSTSNKAQNKERLKQSAPTSLDLITLRTQALEIPSTFVTQRYERKLGRSIIPRGNSILP